MTYEVNPLEKGNDLENIIFIFLFLSHIMQVNAL